MTGRVYLVGAGPGDARLITLKGLDCIKKGDVIVYDRLANPSLLRKAKPGAEKIYVGKRTDRHTMKQEDISRLLVDLALAGKTVVRLKGGDPTVFGRGARRPNCCASTGLLMKSYRASPRRYPFRLMPASRLPTAIWPPPYRSSPAMKARISWTCPSTGKR